MEFNRGIRAYTNVEGSLRTAVKGLEAQSLITLPNNLEHTGEIRAWRDV